MKVKKHAVLMKVRYGYELAVSNEPLTFVETEDNEYAALTEEEYKQWKTACGEPDEDGDCYEVDPQEYEKSPCEEVCGVWAEFFPELTLDDGDHAILEISINAPGVPERFRIEDREGRLFVKDRKQDVASFEKLTDAKLLLDLLRDGKVQST